MDYSLFFNIFLLFVSSVICLYVYFKKSFKYWDGYDIKVMPPEFPYGSLKKVVLRQESLAMGCYNAYKYFKERKQKHGAFFILNKPFYMPIDPEIIKNILIRDFEYFVDRSAYHKVKDDPLYDNIIEAGGNEWKTLRREVSPAFSVSKIKQLASIFHNCCMALIKKLQECSEINKTVEVNEIFACYTSDVVGSSIFGIDINSLENPACGFRIYKFFPFFPLARNVDIQEKLRKEVLAAFEKNNSELDYDIIMNLSYLDNIVKETMRLYPFVSSITRVCTNDYKMEHCNLLIKKGVRVFISTLTLHQDPDYYSNPEVFNPDRFSTENKHPPCTFLPFGEGPRNCVACRFGQLQTKMAITHIIKNFKFSLNCKTGTPTVGTTLSVIDQFASKVYIDFEKI